MYSGGATGCNPNGSYTCCQSVKGGNPGDPPATYSCQPTIEFKGGLSGPATQCKPEPVNRRRRFIERN